jgi:hypothetical protein
MIENTEVNAEARTVSSKKIGTNAGDEKKLYGFPCTMIG